jgi:hypothetical protein
MTSHAPFLMAGLGWLWLGVKETRTTLAASLVALFGVTIMVGGAVTDGHLFGDLLAFRHDRVQGDHDADHSSASRNANVTRCVSFGAAIPPGNLAIRLIV